MNDGASAAGGRSSLIDRSFDLPFGYRATFMWRGADEPIEVHWSPDQPRIRKLRPRRKSLSAYQAARREFFEDVAAVGDGIFLVLDTNLKAICGHEVIVPPAQH
jgi:hypothetical protein